MKEQMDFYIDTIWSLDNIDAFYFRTHPKVMVECTKVLAAMDDALGFLAHSDWDWALPFDPYRLALAAKVQGSPLGFLTFTELTERMVQMGIFDRELRLKEELRPVVERYRRGFCALEQRQLLEDPVRVLGQGQAPSEDDAVYPIVCRALRNDHKSQYELAKLHLDRENVTGKIISFNETEGIYWLHRARDNGNVYAARRILKMEEEKRVKVRKLEL